MYDIVWSCFDIYENMGMYLCILFWQNIGNFWKLILDIMMCNDVIIFSKLLFNLTYFVYFIYCYKN